MDNGGSSQGVRSDKFVVGRVESDDDNTGLAGDSLTAPAEVARIESETSEFAVTATGSYEMDALGTNSSVGRLTTFLEGSLLSVVCALGSRGRSLVS